LESAVKQGVRVVEPALFCAPAAVLLARLSGAKAWLHVQNFEVDAAFSLGLLRGACIRASVTKAESWLMRRFDVVSTISRRMHELLLRKGVPASQAKLAVNWVNMASFALPSTAGVAAYRQELQVPPGAVVALYSGNMGGKQGLEVLAELARLCLPDDSTYMPNTALAQAATAGEATKQIAKITPNPTTAADAPPVVFVFCGNGAGRADLGARCIHNDHTATMNSIHINPVATRPVWVKSVVMGAALIPGYSFGVWGWFKTAFLQ
jgi:colanic acid biosynthesis glycosyl transferase WcaI